MPMVLLPFGAVPELVTLENTEITGAVPAGCSGCWITLVGAGGKGASGVYKASEQAADGGGGGGGGAYIARCFIPVSALGATYTLTNGTTSNRYAAFTSGTVAIKAGWGADGSNRLAGAPGAATATGYTTGIILANGGAGGNGGVGSSPAAGSSGTSVTNGAGAGGGGGGGARGGNSGKVGGSGGTSSGGPGQKGADGTDGVRSGGNATSGNGGGGGGYTAGSGTTGGVSYTKIEWV